MGGGPLVEVDLGRGGAIDEGEGAARGSPRTSPAGSSRIALGWTSLRRDGSGVALALLEEAVAVEGGPAVGLLDRLVALGLDDQDLQASLRRMPLPASSGLSGEVGGSIVNAAPRPGFVAWIVPPWAVAIWRAM